MAFTDPAYPVVKKEKEWIEDGNVDKRHEIIIVMEESERYEELNCIIWMNSKWKTMLFT